MTHPENIVDRYRAAHVLSERGSTEGERTAARNAVNLMAKKYPGIHAQAYPPAPQPPPPQTNQQNYYRTPDQSVPWYERFTGARQAASDAFSWASRVAAEMASLEYARNVADELTDFNTKVLTKERVQIAVKLPLRDLYYISQRFNDAQKAEFASRIAAMVEAEVLRVMEGTD